MLTLTSSGRGQQYLAWPALGIPIDGHEIGHGRGVNGLSSANCFVKVRQCHSKLIAALAARLKSIPEGEGTILDNTFIVYLSASGEAHHPRRREWPVVLLGGLRGKLKHGDRFVQLRTCRQKKHRTLSNLYLTLLQAVGKPRDKFGVADSRLRDIDQSWLVAELHV